VVGDAGFEPAISTVYRLNRSKRKRRK